MTKPFAVTLFMLALAGATASAQDPTKTLPNAYKLDLENAYVRVVRVHYDAGVKLPVHAHTGGTTVYIYLNDSEGVVFKHSGRISQTVTRPAVKTGAVRIASGMDEQHEVENTSKTPSDFLRVYFKTVDSGPRASHRLSPAEDTFENPQMRITRLKIEQHDSETIDAREPALIVELPSGSERWIDAGKSVTIENHEVPELSLIRIDFLKKPK